MTPIELGVKGSLPVILVFGTPADFYLRGHIKEIFYTADITKLEQ